MYRCLNNMCWGYCKAEPKKTEVVKDGITTTVCSKDYHDCKQNLKASELN